MQDISLSIIVPLYNSADVVDHLLQSLINQTDTAFEAVFVDDGSTDQTAEHVQQKLQNARFSYRVLRQENAGPGVARNDGMQCAAGEYILFADGDDYWDKHAVQCIKTALKEHPADILVFGYQQEQYDRHYEPVQTTKVLPVAAQATGTADIAVRAAFLDEQKTLSYVWNKAYKKSLILHHGIEFSSARHSEDYFFVIRLFPYAQTLTVLPEALYHYVKSPRETLTNRQFISDYDELIRERYRAMRDYLESAGVYDGAAASAAANVHIKHIFSAFANDCAKASGLSGRMIRAKIRNWLDDPQTKHALSRCAADSRSGKIMNGILKSDSVPLCYWFSKTVCRMAHSRLFNYLKAR